LTKIKYLPVVDQSVGLNPNNAPDLESIFNYDALSRLTSAVNEAGTVSFTYDLRGRVQTTTDVFGKVLTYNYDANNNRSSLKLDGANYASYIYDDANRLTSITNAADNASINFGYDNANKLTSRNYPNSVTTIYEYDGMSRLTRLKDLGAQVNFDRQYSYNSASQINQITEPANARLFGYDNLDRLTSVTNSTNGNESYSFDAVGNRTSSHKSASYSYQPFNRLTNTATGSYNYDANGNLTVKFENGKRWIFIWDYENRLSVASDRKVRIRYVYDALGRRVARYSGAKGATKFTYDGQDVLLDDDRESAITKYLNGLGIDNKLRQANGTNVQYFLTDNLGSTNALTDASGAIQSQTNYDAFGNQTGVIGTRYGFTGRERDEQTGLMFYRARWYSSELGRFISEDPIGFAGGDVNLYGYVKNSSINLIDPTGLIGICTGALGNPVPCGSEFPHALGSAANFVGRYFFGSGEPFDLGQHGLGQEFESAESVKNAIERQNQRINEEKDSALRCYCDWQNKDKVNQTLPSNYFPTRTTTDVTWHGGLFSVGRSTFFMNTQCQLSANCKLRQYNFDCTTKYSIRDAFTDPLDGDRIFGSPYDLPGSAPYPIIYDFNRNYHSQGNF
jgi:RHS repeat-associated protein